MTEVRPDEHQIPHDLPASEKFRKWVNYDVVAGFFLSPAIGIILSYIITRLLGIKLFPVTLLSGLLLGYLHFMWVSQNIETAYRGVLRILGLRVRIGKQGKGVGEGRRWLPLGWPFMVYKEVSAKEVELDIENINFYTADNIDAWFNLSAGFMVDDPYAYLSVEDAPNQLSNLIQRAARNIGGRQVAQTLMTIRDNKTAIVALSDAIRAEAEAVFDSEHNPGGAEWGLRIVSLNVSKIKVHEELVAAIRRKVVEFHEGEAEQIQIERRKEQIAALKGIGVTADVAAVVALVDAGKEGAKINAVNLHGLGGGTGLSDIGKGMQDLARAWQQFSNKGP